MTELLRPFSSITLRLAQQALTYTIEEANRHSVSVSIAIVGPGGDVMLAAHMDLAPALSRAIALNKALTAASFRVSTAEWESRLERCSTMVRQGLPLQPGLALFGGGEPFMNQGQLIGAIGISGASEAIDTACARAVRAQIEALMHSDKSTSF